MLLFSTSQVFGSTGDSLRVVQFKDSIIISFSPAGDKLFNHIVERKQTIYGISRFYNNSLETLYELNPYLNQRILAPKDTVQVIISNSSIRRYKGNDFVRWKYAPIYYKVKSGDYPYKIAMHHFNMPVDSLVSMNNLEDITLRSGQLLLVGWLSLKPAKELVVRAQQHPMEKQNSINRWKMQSSSKDLTFLRFDGPATRAGDHSGDEAWFALHRSAPIHSFILVENPVTKRTAYVKVVGRPQARAYDSDIIVVLSDGVVSYLGAKDDRFYVRGGYYH